MIGSHLLAMTGLLLLVPGLAWAETPEQPRPWRAAEALDVDWLHFGLEQRLRYEHLSNDFRTTNPGDAIALAMRTLLAAELRFLPVVVGAEMEDSRLWASAGTPLNTGLVNPLELLQGYLGLRGNDVFSTGDSASITAGRMTLDLGSRRLVARNEFRNTVSGFTGIDAEWTSPAKDLLRTFAVMPVVRLPNDPERLEDNAPQVDQENVGALLWGAFFRTRPLSAEITLEVYALGLHERDSDLIPSSNRQLITPGVRALRAPTVEKLDFQLEAMGQFGRSRASAAPTDTTNLEHVALSLHATIGYLFPVSWAPRLALQYDYASGDTSADDGANNRFDPLFGARRFDFGPTGLYGALARSNISSPGIRIEARPLRQLEAGIGYRLAWLASAHDAWPAAGVWDPTGTSGNFLGQQLEARARWHALPKNLVLELGGAVLGRGEFARSAPGAKETTPLYVYTQITGTI